MARMRSRSCNDRLIAVATHARSYAETRSLGDLVLHLVEDIKAFFVQYTSLRYCDFKPFRDGALQEAMALIEQGIAGFRKRKER